MLGSDMPKLTNCITPEFCVLDGVLYGSHTLEYLAVSGCDWSRKNIYFLNLKGMVEESGLYDALSTNEQLSNCLKTMQERGLPSMVGTSFIFVDDPAEYSFVLYKLQSMDNVYIVVTSDLKKYVEAAVRNSANRRRCRLRIVNNSPCMFLEVKSR